MAADKMYNNILIKAEMARNRTKTAVMLDEGRFTGKYNFLEADRKTIENATASIYDKKSYKPDGSSFDVGDLTQQKASFPAAEQAKLMETIFKGLPMAETQVGKSTKDPTTNKVISVYKSGYNDSQLKHIGEEYASRLTPIQLAYYETKLADLPEWTRNNPAFKILYGKDIETAKDMAEASIIIQAAHRGKERQVRELNAEQAQAWKKEIVHIRGKYGGYGFPISSITISNTGGTDLTQKLQGVKVKMFPTGDVLGANKILYDPSTKIVTVNDKEFIASDFFANIHTINTEGDRDFAKALIGEIDRIHDSVTRANPPRKSTSTPSTKESITIPGLPKGNKPKK